MAQQTQYHGTTARGRRVREDSLHACVESLASIAGKALDQCVTKQVHGNREAWYVYASHADLDLDNWFAKIHTELTDA